MCELTGTRSSGVVRRLISPHISQRKSWLAIICGLLVTALLLAGCAEDGPTFPRLGDETPADVPDSSDPSGDNDQEGSDDNEADVAGQTEDPAGDPDGSSDPGEWIEVDPTNLITELTAATWKGGKRAACSVSFDDSRTSHYLLAAPVLDARGIRGTFNIVTSQAGAWSRWQELFDHGHELANHTRSHRYFSQLTPEEVWDEIGGGERDLRGRVFGLHRVASFAYPGGDRPEGSADIVREFHLAARGRQGIESAIPEDFTALRGVGYYAPFSSVTMGRNLEQAVHSGGWYIPYYHSLTPYPQESYLECPLDVFTTHMNEIQARATDLWVAPVGEVSCYIMARQELSFKLHALRTGNLQVRAAASPWAEGVTVTLLAAVSGSHEGIRLWLDGTEVAFDAVLGKYALDVTPGTDHTLRAEVLHEGSAVPRIAQLLDQAGSASM